MRGAPTRSSRPPQEIIAGKLDDQFPLVVWQTGSGTQTNMNVNEVIANRANERLGGARGAKSPIHPNDHVNMSQSSNDSFPTAMHIAAAQEISRRLLPALTHLQAALDAKTKAFAAIVKIGRTHTQDATPLTLGQEFSGYAAQVKSGIARVRAGAEGALSAGPGRHRGRHRAQCQAAIRQAVREAKVAAITGLPFVTAPNKFEALASHGAMVFAHGALNALAADLFKIANDIRFLGSGPRSRLRRIDPAGKRAGLVDHARQGQSDPVRSVDHGVLPRVRQRHHDRGRGKPGPFRAQRLQAGDRLCDAAIDPAARRRGDLFTDHCVAGIRANEPRIRELMERSLMLVTALAPRIGYDKAAQIAKAALAHGTTLREEADQTRLRFRQGIRPAGAAGAHDQARSMTGLRQICDRPQPRPDAGSFTNNTTSNCINLIYSSRER